MRKNAPAKLTLAKETLRRLEGRGSLEAVDGAWSFTCPQISCNSNCATECRSVCVTECTGC